jgi:uncharacterized protein YwqG
MNEKLMNKLNKYFIKKKNKQFIKIVDKFIKSTSVPYIKITAERGKTTPTQSKFGGTPYMPEGFAYPHDNITKKPLRLVAQINFSEVPAIEYFPKKGILQFFIRDDYEYDNENCTVSFLGKEHDELTKQDGWRIIYHENIIRQNNKDIPQFPKVSPEHSNFPIYDELKLSFKKKKSCMPTNVSCFNDEFLKIYKKYINTNANRVFNSESKEGDICLDLETDEFFYLIDALSCDEHRIGGYPDFAQADPRDEYPESNGKYTGYSILLLQITTQCEDNNCDIMWCDGGIANLFIKPEDLKAYNFSNVLYTWDCS